MQSNMLCSCTFALAPVKKSIEIPTHVQPIVKRTGSGIQQDLELLKKIIHNFPFIATNLLQRKVKFS